jgi:DNA replication protein DnaC
MFLSQEQFDDEVKRWESRLVKNCPICNGNGSVLMDNGKRKMCSCMEKTLLNANLTSWGVPRKYLNDIWTWDNCTQQKFVNICKNYATNFKTNYLNTKGLYLYGSQGRGKSTMEALISRDVAMQINPDNNKHFKVAFAIYEDIVRMSLQSNNDRDTKRKLDMLINIPDLLIIDNVGSETGLESGTKYSARLLEFILRKRDNSGLPNLISSNFTPEELIIKYNDVVHDFIVQNCELVLVAGDNFRQKSNQSNLMDEFGGDDSGW